MSQNELEQFDGMLLMMANRLDGGIHQVQRRAKPPQTQHMGGLFFVSASSRFQFAVPPRRRRPSAAHTRIQGGCWLAVGMRVELRRQRGV